MSTATEVPKDVKEIVEFALQLEQDGLKMYRELAEKSSDPFGKKTFQELAEDEEEHLELLRKVYGGSDVDAIRNIVEHSRQEPVRQRFKTVFQLAGKEARKRTASDSSDLEAIRLAMDFEKRGYKIYKEAQGQAVGDAEKKALKHLTLMEKWHYEVLSETFEYLSDTSDWFMKNEGWMFDGG